MGRLSVSVAVGIGTALLVAGCGDGGSAPSRAGSLEMQNAWTACPAEPVDATDALSLPLLDDFPAKAAVICAQRPERQPDGSEAMVAVEERADTIEPLLTALRLPSQPLTDGACTMDLIIPPWLVLLDDQGRWIRPGVPSDACGKPRIEVRNAVDQLRLTRVSSRPLKEIESAEAAKTGCSQGWGDMISAMAELSPDAGKVRPVYDGPATIKLCVYRVPADAEKTGKRPGEFVSGRPLTAAQWTKVKEEVAAAAAPGACTTPADRFAVLLTGGDEIYVELDNCTRLMVGSGDSARRAASPALLAQLK